MSDQVVDTSPELAPERPPSGPWVWAKENLFSSVGSSVLTLVFFAIAFLALRGLLGFITDAGRRWDAVTANMRLLMVQAYPAGEEVSQLHRIWLAVGIVVALTGASMAIWLGGYMSKRRLGKAIAGTGGFFVVMSLIALTLPGVISGEGNTVLELIHVLIGVVLGGVMVAGGVALNRSADAKAEKVHTSSVVAVTVAIVLAILWVIKLPVTAIVDPGPPAVQGIEWTRLASTTLIPLTLLYITAIVAFVATRLVMRFLDGQLVRRIVVSLWVLSYPIIVLVLMRDPEIQYDRFWGEWLLIAVGFGILGGALIYWLAHPGHGEIRWIIGGSLMVAAAVSWFIPMSFLLRGLLLLLAVMVLGTSTFGGEGAVRVRYTVLYVVAVVASTYLVTLVGSESTVEVPGTSYLGGFMLTFVLAITSIGLSFPLGVLLALGRTSTMPLFRLMSTAYIELVRGVPLITWLIFGAIMLPVFLPDGVTLDGIVRAMLAIAFFSAAYLAENVRGGLQSIPKGQYEAAKALGMSTVQMTVFITLPQALRAVIPALVGQVIALFKDTSLITIIGLFDFLHIARAVIPAQTQPFNYLGTIRETLVFAAIVYWVFTFAFSRASLRLEKKLGIGER